MELTYILVDFENVQPPDLGLLHAPHYRVKPAKRATLERHILSLLGGTTSAAIVQGVIAELVRLKLLAFNDKKVSYALKGKK